MRTPSITIESRTLRTVLSDDPEGVRVEVWTRRRTDGPAPVSVRVHHTVIDAPWHVVRDRVHTLVREMEQ